MSILLENFYLFILVRSLWFGLARNKRIIRWCFVGNILNFSYFSSTVRSSPIIYRFDTYCLVIIIQLAIFMDIIGSFCGWPWCRLSIFDILLNRNSYENRLQTANNKTISKLVWPISFVHQFLLFGSINFDAQRPEHRAHQPSSMLLTYYQTRQPKKKKTQNSNRIHFCWQSRAIFLQSFFFFFTYQTLNNYSSLQIWVFGLFFFCFTSSFGSFLRFDLINVLWFEIWSFHFVKWEPPLEPKIDFSCEIREK